MYNKRMKKNILFIIISGFFLLLTTIAAYSNPTASPVNNELAVHFLDVGQGDCTLILLPTGENILIDTGSPSAGPEIIRYLKSMDIKKIDHLIFTHSHDDHIGGVFSILSEFKVINFYDNGFSNFKSTLYGDYIQVIREDLSKYSILQAGESLLFGKVRIDVLNPLLPPTAELNNDSIVLKLIYGKIKTFLAGDMGLLSERRLVKGGIELTSQILKVGHHGENDASSDDFLKKVKPEIAIITVGKMNKYAQPHKAVLSRLMQAGARIYRTDINGHIMLKTDGNTYTMKTANEAHYKKPADSLKRTKK